MNKYFFKKIYLKLFEFLICCLNKRFFHRMVYTVKFVVKKLTNFINLHKSVFNNLHKGIFNNFRDIWQSMLLTPNYFEDKKKCELNIFFLNYIHAKFHQNPSTAVCFLVRTERTNWRPLLLLSWSLLPPLYWSILVAHAPHSLRLFISPSKWRHRRSEGGAPAIRKVGGKGRQLATSENSNRTLQI